MAYKTYRTPGVKPIEKKVFGRTVSTKVTALPIFIGYTQKQPSSNGSKVSNIESKGNTSGKTSTKGSKEKSPTSSRKSAATTTMVKETPTAVIIENQEEQDKLVVHRINSFGEYTEHFGWGHYTNKGDKQFYLFEGIKLFFINGGKTCYIVSVGTYKKKKVAKEDLEKGISKLFEISQANLVLSPDAASLSANERGKFYNKLLKSCSFKNEHGVFINQFAILDATKGLKKHEGEATLKHFENDDHLVHGAMYHPWVKTDVISRADVEQSLLAAGLPFIKKEFSFNGELSKDSFTKLSTTGQASYLRRAKRTEWNNYIDQTIEANSLIPPSAAVAGAFVRNDDQFGIQKAPANINLRGVIELNAVINDTNQGDFNAPENGKSINCLRSFINNEIKIWGTRTLDCNDLDYRYVNVRRTMSMLQELGKYLKIQLRRGVLAGTTPNAAFSYAVGIDDGTMTEEDINEGIIRVRVELALVRPAEFIEIIFEQKSMESAASVEEGVEV